MNNPILGYIVIIFIIGFAAVTIYLLCSDTSRIYAQLDDYDTRAVFATTVDELTCIRKELVAYHNEKCWNRVHGEHAMQVLSYINGEWIHHQRLDFL